MAACICVPLLFQVISAYYLSNLYIDDYNLIVSKSPYIVVDDVVIRDTSTFTVENGVEIIFMGDYTISIHGSFSCGCSNYDTAPISNIRGLANPVDFIHIHGINTSSRVGSISIFSANVQFCNTKFENMQNAIQSQLSSAIDSSAVNSAKYGVDNCEFTDLNYVFYDDSFEINTIIDSYIDNVNYVTYHQGFIYDNLLIKNFGSFYGYNDGMYNIGIRNTEVIGNGGICIQFRWAWNKYADPYAYAYNKSLYHIINNSISRCSYGVNFIRGSSSSYYPPPPFTAIINGNTITNCTQYGIFVGSSSIQSVSYNNFISNTGSADLILPYVHDVQIIHNSFTNSRTQYQIRTLCASNLKIQNNTFIGSNSDSALHYECSDSSSQHRFKYIDITDNQFINNTGMSLIYMRGASYLTVEYNTFINNDLTGKLMYLDHPNYVINITNNLFTLNQVCFPIYHQIYSGPSGDTDIALTNFKYNILKNNIYKLKTCATILNGVWQNFLIFENSKLNIIEYNEFVNNILYDIA
eukprot:416749_1